MLRQRIALVLLALLCVWGMYSCLGVSQWFLDAEPDPDLFTPAVLEPLVTEAVALVETHYGVPFRKRPAVVPIARKALHETLRREEIERLARLDPDASREDLERQARESVGLLPWVWGLYSSNSHTVFLLPKAIDFSFWLIDYIPAAKPKALKLLLVHELAHAMDEEIYGPLDRAFDDDEALRAFRAVMEGHAEFVMRKAADRCGDWSIAEDWIRAHDHRREEPEVAFRYARGREFIEALAKRGPLRMQDVYARPPQKRSQILKPETYP